MFELMESLPTVVIDNFLQRFQAGCPKEMKALPNFWDGTGQFWKMRVPTFWDGHRSSNFPNVRNHGKSNLPKIRITTCISQKI